jgi:hypothetical protein
MLLTTGSTMRGELPGQGTLTGWSSWSKIMGMVAHFSFLGTALPARSRTFYWRLEQSSSRPPMMTRH